MVVSLVLTLGAAIGGLRVRDGRIGTRISVGSAAAFGAVWSAVGDLSSNPDASSLVGRLSFAAVCAVVVLWAAISVIVEVVGGSADRRYVLVLVLAVSLAMMGAVFFRVASGETSAANLAITLGYFVAGPIGMTGVGLLSLLLVVLSSVVSKEKDRRLLRRTLILPGLIALPSLALTLVLASYDPSIVVDTSFSFLSDYFEFSWDSPTAVVGLYCLWWSVAVLIVVAPVVLRSYYRSGSRNLPVLMAAIWMVLAGVGLGAVYVLAAALVWLVFNRVAARVGRDTPATS